MTKQQMLPEGKQGGLFISFEGVEGSGKSTQMRLLVERLRAEGWTVTENQEPGATTIGKQIRRILLDPANSAMTPLTELLLMFASRTQAVAEIVAPALARNEIVVSDRFTDSTLAYQGFGRQLGWDTVLAAHSLALGELWPDVTIYVVLDVETGLQRARSRNRLNADSEAEDRLDEQSLEFHRKVERGYQVLAAQHSRRVHVVDGKGSVAEVAARIWTEIEPVLLSRLAERV